MSREADFELESKKKEIKRELKWAEMLGSWDNKKWKGKVTTTLSRSCPTLPLQQWLTILC
jgi:hypothetical protein